jgi:enoyl-CoA hydratase/carnithine racemase
MRMVLTGEILEGAAALDAGLVEYLVEPDEVFARARALAVEIAGKAPIAIEAAKELVKAAARNTLEGGLMHEIALSTLCFATRDKEEAIAAFREKRPPSFEAR